MDCFEKITHKEECKRRLFQLYQKPTKIAGVVDYCVGCPTCGVRGDIFEEQDWDKHWPTPVRYGHVSP